MQFSFKLFTRLYEITLISSKIYTYQIYATVVTLPRVLAYSSVLTNVPVLLGLCHV